MILSMSYTLSIGDIPCRILFARERNRISLREEVHNITWECQHSFSSRLISLIGFQESVLSVLAPAPRESKSHSSDS